MAAESDVGRLLRSRQHLTLTLTQPFGTGDSEVSPGNVCSVSTQIGASYIGA